MIKISGWVLALIFPLWCYGAPNDLPEEVNPPAISSPKIAGTLPAYVKSGKALVKFAAEEAALAAAQESGFSEVKVLSSRLKVALVVWPADWAPQDILCALESLSLSEAVVTIEPNVRVRP